MSHQSQGGDSWRGIGHSLSIKIDEGGGHSPSIRASGHFFCIIINGGGCNSLPPRIMEEIAVIFIGKDE